MKKMRIGIITLAGLLTLGSGALIALNNKSMIKTEADYQNPVSGLFYRITDVSDLQQGDNVVFVSNNGYILEDVGGNPGFLYGSQTGVKLSNDKNLVFLTNSKGSIFSTYTGGGLASDSFGFRTNMMIVGQKVNGVYLAYNPKSYYGDDTFRYIGGFYGDKTAVDTVPSDRASWRISRDEAHDDMIITNVDNGGDLSFTFSYSTRFHRGGGYNVEIYKMIKPTAITIPQITDPSKTTYYVGEEIDLSGLEIEVSHPRLKTSYKYNEDPDLFSFPKYAPSGTAGVATIEVNFLGVSFNINLNIEQQKFTARRVTSARADYRGSYMLVDDFGPYVIDPEATDVSSCSGTNMIDMDGNVAYVTDQTDYDRYKLSCERDATLKGVYHLKNSAGKYLSLTANPIAFVTGMSSATAVTLEKDSTGIRIKNSNNEYLYTDFEFLVDGDPNVGYPVYLHQYDLGEALDTEVNDYLVDFLGKTSVCDYSGTNNNLNGTTVWSELYTDFYALSLDAQGLFANTTYSHNQEAIGSINGAVDRYDYIVAKYGYTDFMNRKMAGTFVDNYNNPVSPSMESVIKGVNNYAILGVMIVIVSISGLGVFLLLKKKHR